MKSLGWIAAAAVGLWAFTRGQEYKASEKLGFRLIDFDFPLPKESGLIANLRALNSLAGIVRIEISNPTATAIRVDGIYGDLFFGNSRVGRVQSVAPIDMPAGQSSNHDIAATLFASVMVMAAPSLIQKLLADGQVRITFSFKGIIRVAGVDLPYEQEAPVTIKVKEGSKQKG